LKERIEEKEIKRRKTIVSVKAREKKNKEREREILFISRNKVSYIDLYELDRVDWVLKISTCT